MRDISKDLFTWRGACSINWASSYLAIQLFAISIEYIISKPTISALRGRGKWGFPTFLHFVIRQNSRRKDWGWEISSKTAGRNELSKLDDVFKVANHHKLLLKWPDFKNYKDIYYHLFHNSRPVSFIYRSTLRVAFHPFCFQQLYNLMISGW